MKLKKISLLIIFLKSNKMGLYQVFDTMESAAMRLKKFLNIQKSDL